MNKPDEFTLELRKLINKHSIENLCDVPDYILAEMITGLIVTIGKDVKRTLDWHGIVELMEITDYQKEIKAILHRIIELKELILSAIQRLRS